METQAIGEYVLPKAPPARNDYLDQAMFLRLLVAQLTTQNPLEPMTERDFFAQLAQLGTVQGIDRLGNNLQIAQAAGLIGREVELAMPGESFSGTLIRGRVESVEIVNRKVYIRVNGGVYDINNMVRIVS